MVGRPGWPGRPEDGLTIAGQGVALTSSGLALAGSTTPLPPSDPLNQILSQAGIEVAYLAPAASGDGVVSAGLAVRMAIKPPTAAVTQPTLVTLEFGRASASAHGGAGGFVGGGAPSAGADSGASGTAGLGSDLGPATPANTSLPGESSFAPAGVGSGFSGQGSAASPAVKNRTGTGRIAATTVVGPGTGSFYLVLVVGALLALGGVQLIRFFGVRLAWNS